MIQQSLYIIHGDLTGMCWGRGGRFKFKDYQQDVSAGFTISIVSALRLNADKVYTVLISDQKQAKNP